MSSKVTMEKILDDLLKFPQCQEVTEEQLQDTLKGLEDGTFDPVDLTLKLMYESEHQETDDKEEDSGLNEIASDPPHCLLPRPSSSKSSGYHSGSSEGSLSPLNQCSNGGKFKKCRKQRHVNVATISEESEDGFGDDEDFVRGSELSEEENQCTDNMDFRISEKEKRKLEYLKLLQAFRELNEQIDSNDKDDEDEISVICGVKKRRLDHDQFQTKL